MRKNTIRAMMLILCPIFVFASEDVDKLLQSAGKKYSEQNWEAALKDLSTIEKLAKEAPSKSLSYFARGRIYFEQQNDAKAQEFLQKSIATDSSWQDYSNFLLGKSFYRQSQLDKAVEAFAKANANAKASFIKEESLIFMGQIAIEKREFAKAKKYLMPLERKMRRSPDYPDVLWALSNLAIESGNRNDACKWAKKIYTRFPAYTKVASWNIEFDRVKLQNREISCPINREDKRSRVRHLQLSGLSTRALSEIESLESKLAKEDKYYYDKLLADFHIQDGHVQEALDILLPHYVKQKNNFDYLNSLAKAAARAGELSTAVNAYYSVYKLSPSSRKGRFALFQTAFLSYQFQDYDGASRRFNEFVNKYAKSGLSLDAKWHLAWIRYLKSDFQGAYDQFTMLSKTANSFRRQDRIVYWRAMSLMRMNRYKDAEKLFKELSDNESYSFYALAAKSRLLQFKSQMQERQLAGLNSELNMIELSGSEDVNAVQASEGKLPAVSESQESEENISAISSSEEMNEASEESAESTDNAIAEESKDNSETSDIAFTQPILQEKFSRAQWLKKLAFNDYSRWELFEIEKRSKQKNHLKNLMSEYQSIGAYHRSSYIGQIHFGREQQQLGMKAVKSLWEFTFPQSYKNFVSKYANEYGIPNEMIWAIMRAESHYKADVKSQVGAMGLMQLMPYTAEKLARIAKVKNPSIDDLLQPEINIQLGARYLKRLAVKYDSKIPLVAAAYNAGPHRVDSWLYSFGRIDMDEFIEHIPFLETRNYAKQVFRNFMVYQSLYSGESKAEALGLAMLSQNVGVQSTSGITAKEDWVTEY